MRGQQRKVVTLGQNKKHFLAGALQAKTGQVTYVGSNSKSTVLFIDLLIALRKRYRSAKTITLIVDNYIIHKSKKAQHWLENNPKFRLLFLPVYSPWHNKIELLWHSLHETVTRNHSCKSMNELWNGLNILWIPRHRFLAADTGSNGCSINRIIYLVNG